MCHNRINNDKINRLHENCLHLTYSNRKSFFEELLEKEYSVFIYQRNLRVLAVEMYNVYMGSSQEKAWDFYILQMKSTSSSLESVGYLCPKIWEAAPCHINASTTLELSKHVTKQWKSNFCLYKSHLRHL